MVTMSTLVNTTSLPNAVANAGASLNSNADLGCIDLTDTANANTSANASVGLRIVPQSGAL